MVSAERREALRQDSGRARDYEQICLGPNRTTVLTMLAFADDSGEEITKDPVNG